MSDDLIKRSDAIGAITNHCENECYYRVDSWCPQCQREEFQEAIKAVPSADRPQGKWIPCSEREPNEFVDVLVCLTDGTMDVVQLTDYIDIDGKPKWCHSTNYILGGAILNKDIVAWMPLPEPWKGADDES